ncbi:hypothetical protein HPB48_009784 [Haemaphysalis longicornis]|uniref:Endothelin-converting enzyme n=1 Tax=Haemaphysalis longicornis TaxID=44386 RepID=A0A9J6GPV3_HAELO|nr:hypothetical protein HPB48_009784 [Haemaphysalis longicornis]
MGAECITRGAIEYFNKLYTNLAREDLSLFTAWELVRTLAPLSIANVARGCYTFVEFTSMCLKAAVQAMEVPLYSWYLFSHVPQSTVGASRAMAQRIKEAIINQTKHSDWLSGQTKAAATEKVDSMGVYVGYPKYFESHYQMDDVYRSYPDVGAHFLTPWITAIGKTMEWQIQNRTSFRFSVTTTNAYYHSALNKIVIPAAALRPPLVSRGNSTAMSYGGLGAIVGHEMSHAFDAKGGQWDAQGRQRDWWSQQSREKYMERVTCLRRSHGLTTDEQDAENMADFVGLLSAYIAYQSLEEKDKTEPPELNPEQIFFIASCTKWVCIE